MTNYYPITKTLVRILLDSSLQIALMYMYKLVFLVAFLPVLCISQTVTKKVLTDTSMAVGIVPEDIYVGKTIGSYCINGSDKKIKKGTIILISGIVNCSDATNHKRFFEILHNKETLYIQKEKLLTEDTYYSEIENMSTQIADSFRNHAKYVSSILYQGQVNKAFKFLDGCKTKGLAIIDWSFYDESEHTEGTGIKINVYNPTQKTIKYLWFSFVGFNPVGDKVVDRKRGTNITMQGVGPIKPDASGSYEYEYVWFTDLVETVKINSIKVQYMDGTIKIISNPKQIEIPNEHQEFLFDQQ